MADSKLSIVNLGDVAGPMADVASKLIDKLDKAAGYILPPNDERKAESKAYASLFMEIAENKNLDPIERAAKIWELKRTIKEYKNQSKVVSGAIPFLKEDAKPEKMDEDWTLFFMDKIRLVSDEDLQLIWSRILAQEANDCGSVSKQLLQIMSQMCRKDADRFMNLLIFCVDVYTHDSSSKVGTFPVVPSLGVAKKSSIFAYSDALKLESYGLIKIEKNVRFNDGKVIIKYGDKTIFTNKNDSAIIVGRVCYAHAGMELSKICERFYDERVCEEIKDYLNIRNSVKS